MGDLTADRALLDAFRAGEPDALKSVFRHYAPHVARSVRRGVRLVSGDRTLAFRGITEDHEVERVVLDTFSRAFQASARQRFDGTTPYEAYLCRVARNLLISEARSARHAPLLTDSGELPDLQSLEPDPEQEAGTKALRAEVAGFVAGRPDLERRVFEARFERGDTQQEAALRLGINRITIRRAEARLKDAVYRFLLRRGWAGARRDGGEEQETP